MNIAVVLILIWCSLAQAETAVKEIHNGAFIVPNEKRPIDAQSIFEAAPQGIIVGPGTERMLYNAVMNPNATHVVVTDIDRFVIRFHQINNLLLKITPAGNREAYKSLRLNENQAAWQISARGNNWSSLSQEEKDMLRDPEMFWWWEKTVRQDPKWKDVYSVATKVNHPFFGVNYLHDDEAFNRVQKLAREGRIEAIKVDLGNANQIKSVVDGIKAKGLSLSVLDLSNAWEYEYPNFYLGEEKTGRLLEEFDRIAQDKSVIVATRGQNFKSRGDVRTYDIAYRGMTYEKARSIKNQIDWGHLGERKGFLGATKELAFQLKFAEYGEPLVEFYDKPSNCSVRLLELVLGTTP
jgi:hypothetical protein